MPMPFPLMTANYHAANRTAMYRKPTINKKDVTHKSTRVKHAAAARNDTASASIVRRAGTVAVAKTSTKISSKGRRADDNADSSNDYDKLNGYYNAASTHSKNLRTFLSLHHASC
jgi:hypothetical protein